MPTHAAGNLHTMRHAEKYTQRNRDAVIQTGKHTDRKRKNRHSGRRRGRQAERETFKND